MSTVSPVSALVSLNAIRVPLPGGAAPEFASALTRLLETGEAPSPIGKVPVAERQVGAEGGRFLPGTAAGLPEAMVTVVPELVGEPENGVEPIAPIAEAAEPVTPVPAGRPRRLREKPIAAKAPSLPQRADLPVAEQPRAKASKPIQRELAQETKSEVRIENPEPLQPDTACAQMPVAALANTPVELVATPVVAAPTDPSLAPTADADGPMVRPRASRFAERAIAPAAREPIVPVASEPRTAIATEVPAQTSETIPVTAEKPRKTGTSPVPASPARPIVGSKPPVAADPAARASTPDASLAVSAANSGSIKSAQAPATPIEPAATVAAVPTRAPAAQANPVPVVLEASVSPAIVVRQTPPSGIETQRAIRAALAMRPAPAAGAVSRPVEAARPKPAQLPSTDAAALDVSVEVVTAPVAKEPSAPARPAAAPSADAPVRETVSAANAPVEPRDTPKPAIPLASIAFMPAPHTTPAATAAPVILLSEALAPLRRPAPREGDASILLTPLALETIRHSAPPIADPQAQPLDTRRHEWIAALADRIDALRETPGSRETAIRLSPDALGAVDVSISREGDRYHVRITAETPQARALLAEAQPRLTELAEARGLRLGQTQIDAGSPGHGHGHGAGQQQRQEPAPRPAFPSAPPSARTEADTDEARIA